MYMYVYVFLSYFPSACPVQGVTTFEVSVHVSVDGIDVVDRGGTMCGTNEHCSFTVWLFVVYLYS